MQNKRPSIKRIAELAQVSRGTVDRALNRRPGVNPEVAADIRRIAAEIGYAPNRAAKSLRFNYAPKTIAVLLPDIGTEFFDHIRTGVRRAETELQDMGISTQVVMTNAHSETSVLETLQSVVDEADPAGVVMTGPDTPALRRAVDELSRRGIPVVTVNSDITADGRLCFVGQDLHRSGVVAAEIMAKLTRGPGRIIAVTGNLSFQAHRDRVLGFQEGIARWATGPRGAASSAQGARGLRDASSSTPSSAQGARGLRDASSSAPSSAQGARGLRSTPPPPRETSSLRVDVLEGFDSYEGTTRILEQALGFSKRPPDDRADEELLGIYMATGSVPACLDVLHAHDLAGRIRLVTNDASTAVKRGLEEGVIDFTILQDPVHQGYTPVKVLHEYLLTGTAPETTWYQSPIRIMGAETESG